MTAVTHRLKGISSSVRLNNMTKSVFIRVLICAVVSTGMHSSLSGDMVAVKLRPLESATNWRAAGVEISSTQMFNGHPALSISIPLADQPTSKWFTIASPITSASGPDWRLFDRFEFYAMATTDTPDRNIDPIRLVCRFVGAKGAILKSATVEFHKLGRWVHASLSLHDVKDLGSLQAIQFQFAKKWSRYSSRVTFYAAGFQLATPGENPDFEPVLLTPSVSLEEPLLYVHAPVTSTVFVRKGVNADVQVDPSGCDDNELAFDMSHLGLAAGIHKLVVFNSRTQTSKTFSFQWIPVEVLSADIGESLHGVNTATAEIRNVADEPVVLTGVVRLNGSIIASKDLTIRPRCIQSLDIDWPLLKDQNGTVQFEIMLARNRLRQLSKAVNPPHPLGKIPSHMAIMFDGAEQIRFRVPIAVAAKSRTELKLYWKWLDDTGAEVSSGTTDVDGPQPLITMPRLSGSILGPYSLRLSLNTDDTATTTTKVYFVEQLPGSGRATVHDTQTH